MPIQVDSDGLKLTMMQGIIDYRKDAATAVTKENMYIVTKRVQKKIGRPQWDGNSWFNGGTSLSHGSI